MLKKWPAKQKKIEYHTDIKYFINKLFILVLCIYDLFIKKFLIIIVKS
jgi:hypothetical protein